MMEPTPVILQTRQPTLKAGSFHKLILPGLGLGIILVMIVGYEYYKDWRIRRIWRSRRKTSGE
jgi:hypothetical protein